MDGTEARGRVDRSDGVGLAWAMVPGSDPVVVFLCGLRSDMEGSKAIFLRDRCAAAGRAFLRLDYSGHGASDGAFEAGTIGRWADDAATVIESHAPRPLILVGSSMGGWIALLLARRWGVGRVLGLVGVAAAPDFTEDLIPAQLSAADRQALDHDGVTHLASEYGEPLPITAALLADGRDHLLLRAPLTYAGPVHLLQGRADPDVPWGTAERLLAVLPPGRATLTLVEDGDHRLSRPADLALLWAAVAALPEVDGA